MNKKRLMALPIVCVVVGLLGASVMAAGSASKGFTVTDANGNDVTANFEGTTVSGSGYDLSDDSEWDFLDSEIAEVNKEAKRADAELVAYYDISGKTNGKVTITFTGLTANAGDVFIVFHEAGDYEYSVSSDPSITVSSTSPFLVYRIAVASSAQTGEYAASYIVMVSVALVACGAVFAVRAKKATK